MKRALVLALVAAAALPAAAQADTGCKLHPQSSYRMSAVLDRGVPVKVTCDGPATFHVGFEYKGRKVEDAIFRMFPDSARGMQAFTKRPVTLNAAGSATARLHVVPWARRLARRFPRVKLYFFLAVQRADGEFVSGPRDRATAILVRR